MYFFLPVCVFVSDWILGDQTDGRCRIASSSGRNKRSLYLVISFFIDKQLHSVCARVVRMFVCTCRAFAVTAAFISYWFDSQRQFILLVCVCVCVCWAAVCLTYARRIWTCGSRGENKCVHEWWTLFAADAAVATAATATTATKQRALKKNKASHELSFMHFMLCKIKRKWHNVTSTCKFGFLSFLPECRRRAAVHSLFYLQNISEKASTSKCHPGKRYHQRCFFPPPLCQSVFLSAKATEPSQKCWCWDIWEGAAHSCDPLIPSFPSASLLVGFHLLVALWGKT